MLSIGIIVGSTRPGRLGRQVADWVYKSAPNHPEAEFTILDLQDFALPLFDETVIPMMTAGTQPHTRRWAEAVAGLDGFVVVTPEYNHGIPAALKNAIDYLYAEWNGKAVGLVSYGADGGVRAAEHLRGVFAQVRVATVGPQVTLALGDDFRDYSTLAPRDKHLGALSAVLTDVVAWSGALRGVRAPAAS